MLESAPGENAWSSHGDGLVLDHVPLFAGLNEAEIKAISGLGTIRAFPKDAVIITEGGDPQALYIVIEGNVRVYLTSQDGREITLRTQGPREYFGELALLDDAPASASVIALESCRCLALSKQSFKRCYADYPDVSLRLLQQLANRVRQLTDEVKSLALLDVYQRVVRALLGLAAPQGAELVINRRMTHQAIADRVSASREMVSRVLKDLSDGGYLKFEKDRIVILRKLPASW
jgi:CRP/FNR family transcriptional regulator, cyclic AMP receptor protein